MKTNTIKVGTPITSRRSKLQALLLALTCAIASPGRAELNLNFDEYLKQGILQSIRGDSAGALASFKVAAFNCTDEANDHTLLLKKLLPIMQERPLDPSGHIAIGLLYDRYCSKKRGEEDRYPDFDSASENEMRYAIAISPNRQNYEAQRVLNDWLKSRNEASLKRCGHAVPAKKRDLLAQLLTEAWEPTGKKQLVTTIKIINTPTGELLPEVEIPSSDQIHDATVTSAIRKVLSVYPMLRWADQTFVFYSSEGSSSVSCVTFLTELDHQRTDLFDGTNSRELKADPAIGDYLRQHLTEDAFLEYCRDETEGGATWLAPRFPPIRNGDPSLQNPNFPGTFQSGGYLFPLAQGRARGIECGTLTVNGKLAAYDLSIGGRAHWDLEIDPQEHWVDSSQYMKLRRIRKALFFAILKYQLQHLKDSKDDEWLKRQPPDGQWLDKIEADGPFNQVYTCPLKDGRTISAKFDRFQLVKSVAVDGVRDKVWSNAVDELMSDPYEHKHRN